LVQAILKKGPAYSMNESDVFISNDPYEGGTHIPDVIVGLNNGDPRRSLVKQCPTVHGQRRVVMST
ncbi:MAG: hydantoinase B/oxoprolinase family protein, partial [Proteobacteria bacterium]|nr:hydantoinase B/oxoprolinase family protein [Pseudomonadota bacterium]